MSTRANIIIKDDYSEVILYHHWDGYPQGLGEMLNEFIHQALEKGYFYCSESMANHLVKEGLKVYDQDGNEVRHDDEFKVSSGLHGDIEYLYTIKCVLNSVAIKCGCERYQITCQKVTDWKDGKPKLRKVEIPDSLNDPCQVRI